jgi:hypothetical protein
MCLISSEAEAWCTHAIQVVLRHLRESTVADETDGLVFLPWVGG